MSKKIELDYRYIDIVLLEEDEVLERISEDYEPDQVFSFNQLKNWALSNGFTEEEV